LEYTSQLRVRYAHTDAMGIVYHGNYYEYFEAARVELMRHAGLNYTELVEAGYYMPLIESHCEYKKPAKFDDLLDITCKMVYDGALRVKLLYKIHCNGILICTGHTVHVFTTVAENKIVKPPKLFLDYFKESA